SLSLGIGYAPFWLDGKTYAFVYTQENTQEIRSGVVGELLPQPILTLDDLLPYLPNESGQHPHYRFSYAFVEPSVPGKLFVAVLDTTSQTIYVLAVDYTVGDAAHGDAAHGDIALLMQAGYHSGGMLSLSPDGHWLLMTGFAQDDPATPYVTTLFMHDLRTGVTRSLRMGDVYNFVGGSEFDWSADGKWLAVMLGTEGFVLSVPDEDYIQFVPYTGGLCAAVSWIDK
ncbi:MAG: hypothetical protein KC413_21700, partial [Anaerolineales bacterium]|nr:hypothetical protein [Anaerolineales bacterium]